VSRPVPPLASLLAHTAGPRPVAFVLAGHNGSGKSTLWYSRLADALKIPLVNADRLIMSILPDPDETTKHLVGWAQRLRDKDVQWQGLAQDGVRLFKELVMSRQMPFAFETVFSHWKLLNDGRYESKVDDIRQMQSNGYFVVLLFVGLTSPDLSAMRVATRVSQGGHDIPYDKLLERFPRTQAAIGAAATVADLTIMFDNSRDPGSAFSLVRAQKKRRVLFDARDPAYSTPEPLLRVCRPWLDNVVGTFKAPRKTKA